MSRHCERMRTMVHVHGIWSVTMYKWFREAKRPNCPIDTEFEPCILVWVRARNLSVTVLHNTKLFQQWAEKKRFTLWNLKARAGKEPRAPTLHAGSQYLYVGIYDIYVMYVPLQ